MPIKINIIDDDPFICQTLASVLTSKFTNIELFSNVEPTVNKDMDVYFVDNFFGTEEKGAELILQIYKSNPKSLVIAMSEYPIPDLIENTMQPYIWDKFWKNNEIIFSSIQKIIEDKKENEKKLKKSRMEEFLLNLKKILRK